MEIRSIIIGYLVLVATAFLPCNADVVESKDAWVDLIDGVGLESWKASASGEVDIVGGEIRILATENLWLVHRRSFTDFVLEVEAWMPSTKYNSGIGFRCSKDKKPLGYQCEIDAQESGSIYAIGKGWVWPTSVEGLPEFRKSANNTFKDGEWNRFRIRCRGNHIQIWINDIMITDVHDDLFKEGSVALQHHGRGDVHRFRNIRIKEL